MIFFNSFICYSNGKIILKIIIKKVNCITLLFALIQIAVNYSIYDTKGNKFVILSSSNWQLILMFLYKRLLIISQCKAPMMQCFCILTNALNSLGRGNDLPPYTILTAWSIGVVSNESQSSNSLGFCGKTIECLQISLYDLGLQLLLGLSFMIIIARCTHTIMAFSADIRPSNILEQCWQYNCDILLEMPNFGLLLLLIWFQ